MTSTGAYIGEIYRVGRAFIEPVIELVRLQNHLQDYLQDIAQAQRRLLYRRQSQPLRPNIRSFLRVIRD